MGGLDVHFFNGKLLYKIFAAGTTYATGLTLPEAPTLGSNTTPTPFPLASDDVIFSRFRVLFVHTMLLRFTSCALNGPPLGIQDQSQKKSMFSHKLDINAFVMRNMC